MSGSVEKGREAIRPEFNPAIMIDFQGAKIEWHDGELFPRIGFMVTNSKLPAGKVVKV